MQFYKHAHDSRGDMMNFKEWRNLNSEVAYIRSEDSRFASINQPIMNIQVYEVVEAPTAFYQWY